MLPLYKIALLILKPGDENLPTVQWIPDQLPEGIFATPETFILLRAPIKLTT